MIFVNDLSDCIFVFSHGAGAGIDSDFMKTIQTGLSHLNAKVVMFEFPYMVKIRELGTRRPPDRMPKLIDSFREQLALFKKDHIQGKKIFIGGKSMGGRVASLLAIEQLPFAINGVICMGFPFHPPKKPEKFRGEHLSDISVPTLILQGERDPFGTASEIQGFRLSTKVEVSYIGDGDHSFKPRVKSGLTIDQNYSVAISQIAKFMMRN